MTIKDVEAVLEVFPEDARAQVKQSLQMYLDARDEALKVMPFEDWVCVCFAALHAGLGKIASNAGY